MARHKRGALRADGTVEGAKVFSTKASPPLGTLVHSPRGPTLLTFWHASEVDCLAAIWQEYVEARRIGWMARHYWYHLKNNGFLKIDNDRFPHSKKNSEKWVIQLLANAREAEYWGPQSWNVVVDPGEQRSHYYHSRPLREWVRGLSSPYYWADKRRGQQRVVVLCTEKVGLFGALRTVADQYAIDVLAFGGNESLTVKHYAAVEFQALLDAGSDVVLLYVGDLDAGGIDIERDFYETLVRHGYRGAPPIRIALLPEHTADITPEYQEKVNLETNTKARNFVKQYPQLRGIGYQIEGMAGRRLLELIEAAIRPYVDIEALNDAVSVGDAVETWMTPKLQEAIADYEQRHGIHLYKTMLEPGQLIDDRTNEPFPPEIIERYLVDNDGGNDDGGNDDEDEASPLLPVGTWVRITDEEDRYVGRVGYIVEVDTTRRYIPYTVQFTDVDEWDVADVSWFGADDVTATDQHHYDAVADDGEEA